MSEAQKLNSYRRLLLGRKVMTILDSILKSREITLLTNVHLVKASSHVLTWELDHKEGWEPKNWCFWTVVLEKTPESPLDSKEIKAVNSKENQSWTFIGRTDAEPPILWPPDAKSQLIGKDPDAGKDWRQEEKGTTEDEMVGWHHWLNGHEFEQARGNGEEQASLVCCSSWCCKESDRTSWLSNSNTKFIHSTNDSNSRYLKQSSDQKKKIHISFYLF